MIDLGYRLFALQPVWCQFDQQKYQPNLRKVESYYHTFGQENKPLADKSSWDFLTCIYPQLGIIWFLCHAFMFNNS